MSEPLMNITDKSIGGEMISVEMSRDEILTLESVRAMQAKIDKLEAENKTITQQKGVACLKHDLIHYIKCGHCYDELEAENKQLLTIANQAKKYIFSRCRKKNRGDSDMCAYMSMSLMEFNSSIKTEDDLKVVTEGS
jgi:hypothetical protein